MAKSKKSNNESLIEGILENVFPEESSRERGLKVEKIFLDFCTRFQWIFEGNKKLDKEALKKVLTFYLMRKNYQNQQS